MKPDRADRGGVQGVKNSIAPAMISFPKDAIPEFAQVLSKYQAIGQSYRVHTLHLEANDLLGSRGSSLQFFCEITLVNTLPQKFQNTGRREPWLKARR